MRLVSSLANRASLSAAVIVLAAGCSQQLDVLGPGSSIVSGFQPALIYRFNEGTGDTAFDSSGFGELSHLRIADLSRVTWIPGGLRIDAPTRLTSSQPPTDLVEACKLTGELTIEAWVAPAVAEVEGSHRILSLSTSESARNFMLGQGGLFDDGPLSIYAARVRTTATTLNGLPMLRSPQAAVQTSLTHLVYRRKASGSESIWVNATQLSKDQRLGTFSNWSNDYRLIVGDEYNVPDERRAWLGELYHLAVYARALDDSTISARFAARLPD